MPIPTRANRPKSGWAVLLYGPSPEIQLLAGELDDSGLEIVPIGDHFFLQAPEVLGPPLLARGSSLGSSCCLTTTEHCCAVALCRASTDPFGRRHTGQS